MLVAKKFLIISLVLHLFIIALASLVTIQNHHLKKTFVVFGAHTHKPVSVKYKSLSTAIPIVSNYNKKSPPTKKINNLANASLQKAKSSPKPSKEIAKKTAEKVAAKKQSTLPKHKFAEISKTKKSKATHQEKITKNIKQKKALREKKSHKKTLNKTVTPEENIETLNDNSLNDVPDQTSNDAHLNSDPEAPSILLGLIDNQDQQESLIYKKEIQQEVDRLWRPPVGVPKGSVCSILFTVGTDGSVACSVAQASSILIYDLSILQVARSFKFPKALWGKQFKIAFRQ